MIGALENFNLNAFLDCAYELVRADEIERALWVLSNLPAYYRDNQPSEVTKLRNLITQRIATPSFYSKFEADIDFNVPVDYMKETLRGKTLLTEVKNLNENNLNPHIVDYGPGEFWAPRILFDDGLFYTYKPLTICNKAKLLFDDHFPHFRGEPDKDDPTVFLACEIIEHLWNEAEIKTVMLSSVGMADVIHISTPRYTFDGRDQLHQGERVRDVLGHLRAYTPNEFVNKVAGIFPEYHWQYIDSQIMQMRLVRKDSKYLGVLSGFKF